MNSEHTPLAVRRAHLVAECAAQRGDLADHLNALKAPAERIGGAGGFLLEHRKSVLAGAGLAAGLLIARPKWLLTLAAGGMSAWKIAQNAWPSVQRVLPLVRARLGGHLE
ncbi:YqjK family protein [Massilia sp. GCM10023247]|uniref:YqjK family protein n=1 Tax=Massilia sp. GCM10023247 TaxID=3252643 RepID=UPI00360C3508